MLRNAVPVLAVFALLVAGTPADAKRTKKPEPAPSVPPAARTAAPSKAATLDVQALVEEAKELWYVKQDYNGALEKFNAAVEADPKDWDVRLQRGHFFEVVSTIVVPEEEQKYKALAHDDFASVSNAQPDSITGGVARDGLTRLSGKTLIEGAQVTCPSEATAAHNRAEDFYGAHHFDEAAAEYERAVGSCPASAAMWVNYADVYYLQGQNAKAKELFVKALTIDPWNRAAHRFLGDTEVRLENLEAAVHQLELAVISDPVYEAAWSGLRTYAGRMGRSWKRVYGQKTEVTRGPDKDGKQNVTIAVPPVAKPGAKDIDASVWVGYGMAKASVFSGTAFDTDPSGKSVERKVKPETMSALEIERESVKSTLQMAREMDAKAGDKPGSFWSMMARAEGAGFLDEAIFLHMLDAPLAAEYPAFREKNSERLVTYLDTMIVP